MEHRARARARRGPSGSFGGWPVAVWPRTMSAHRRRAHDRCYDLEAAATQPGAQAARRIRGKLASARRVVRRRSARRRIARVGRAVDERGELRVAPGGFFMLHKWEAKVGA